MKERKKLSLAAQIFIGLGLGIIAVCSLWAQETQA